MVFHFALIPLEYSDLPTLTLHPLLFLLFPLVLLLPPLFPLLPAPQRTRAEVEAAQASAKAAAQKAAAAEASSERNAAAAEAKLAELKLKLEAERDAEVERVRAALARDLAAKEEALAALQVWRRSVLFVRMCLYLLLCICRLFLRDCVSVIEFCSCVCVGGGSP